MRPKVKAGQLSLYWFVLKFYFWKTTFCKKTWLYWVFGILVHGLSLSLQIFRNIVFFGLDANFQSIFQKSGACKYAECCLVKGFISVQTAGADVWYFMCMHVNLEKTKHDRKLHKYPGCLGMFVSVLIIKLALLVFGFALLLILLFLPSHVLFCTPGLLSAAAFQYCCIQLFK